MKAAKKRIKISKKSQSWSIDVVLGVIIFFAAFMIFYFLLSSKPDTKVSRLKKDGGAVVEQIASDEAIYKIVDGYELNASKLGQLKNITYEELKKMLRIEGDFCIYLEDEKGNIVLINNSYMGIGSPNINLNGVPCSQK